MTKLELLLLGPPETRVNGRLITIQRRVPRALLYYLAAQGNLVSRDRVLDLFWGSSISENRRRLTENLSRLRAGLPGPDLVISAGDLIGLNFDQIYVDQHHFQNLIDKAGHSPWQTPENQPLPSPIFDDLNTAVNLWRADHYLEGFHYPNTSELDFWLQMNAEKIEHSRFNILTRLTNHEYAAQNLPAALAYAKTALIYDEFNEILHTKILIFLSEMGQTREAQEHFEKAKQSFIHELGINPPPRMVQVYRKIRNHEYISIPEIQPNWEIHPSLDAPFVGRDQSLREIQRTRAAKLSLILLGESGQGKTRLMQEFVSRIDPKPRILIANCRLTESAIPFHPLIELLRYHLTPDEWLALPAVWAAYLVGLFPELVQIRHDLQPIELPDNPDQAQPLIFEGLRQVFILMNTHRPLFLIIDDAQWADGATLSTLAYLTNREPFTWNAQLAVIARQEELNEVFQRYLDTISQEKHTAVITIDALNSADINHLAQTLLNTVLPDEFIDDLERETGGNTFFVLEILRAIIESDTDELPLQKLPITENLQNLIQFRIRKLSKPAADCLDLAAVIGPTFSLPILSTASLKPLDELLPVIEAIERSLLIVPAEQQHGEIHYCFVHDKIREALLSAMPPIKIQRYNSQVAHAIETSDAPKQAAVLAYHFEQAGKLKTAYHYWLQAADQARAVFAKEETQSCYKQAEVILPLIESALNESEIYELYSEWSDLAYNVNDTAVLGNIGNELIRIGQNRSSNLLIGTGLDTLGDRAMTSNDFSEGLEYTNRAIPYLEKARNKFELIEAYNHQGVFLYMLNRLEEAFASFQDALTLSAENGSAHAANHLLDKPRANAHYQTALLQTLFGKPNLGRYHGHQGLEFAEKCRHTYQTVSLYSILALSNFYLGEFIDGERYAVMGIDLAKRSRGWRMLGYLESYASMNKLALGKIEEAWQHAEQAVHLGEKFGQKDIIALGYRQLGQLHLLLHNYPKAVEYHQMGFNAIPQSFMGVDNLYRLGLAQAYLGDPGGLDTILAAHAGMKEAGVVLGIVAAQICQALALRLTNHWEKVAALAVELETTTIRGGMANFHLIAVLLTGEAALHAGDPGSAVDHFQFAIGEARLMQNPWLEIKAQICLQNAYQALGKAPVEPEKRINRLLDQLEISISTSNMLAFFKNFRTQIAERSRPTTDTL